MPAAAWPTARPTGSPFHQLTTGGLVKDAQRHQQAQHALQLVWLGAHLLGQGGGGREAAGGGQRVGHAQLGGREEALGVHEAVAHQPHQVGGVVGRAVGWRLGQQRRGG